MKFNLSINHRLLLTFGVLLVVIVVLIIPLLQLNFKINQTSYQVDLAGRNRMLTQRIAANVLMVKATKNETQLEDSKKKLRKTYDLLKKSLEVLENGGVAPDYDSYMNILPANEDERFQIGLVKEILDLQERDFFDVLINDPPFLKQQISKTDTIRLVPALKTATNGTIPAYQLKRQIKDTLVENPKYQKAFAKFVNSYSESQLLNACIELVKAYVAKNDNANAFLYKYMIFAGLILLITIIITVVICFRIVRTIRQTLHQATDVLRDLGRGQIPDKIKVKDENEITEFLETTNGMIENMHQLVNYTHEVGNGNFKSEVKLFNNTGTIYESLEKMRVNLQKAEKEDAERAWFNQGLAELGEILRDNQNDTEKLYPSLIKFIVRYIKANQGALFLVNDDNEQHLFHELVSFYGYEKHRYYEKQLELKEGLLGQAYLDKEPIFMTEVPQFYTKITSGLGEATPNCLALFPLLFNEEVIGVIEVASFEVLSKQKVSFMTRISENIASAIYTARQTFRTKALLDKANIQSEELLSQEEEMRQNMEELRAKQEEMRRITQENINQRMEIEEKYEAVLKELIEERKKNSN
jgi:methyl-accepting chemotaxis protein